MALNLTMKLTKAEQEWASDLLVNWNRLNEKLTELSREQVEQLLAYEVQHEARLTVVQRLTARYSVVEAKENEITVTKAMAKRYS